MSRYYIQSLDPSELANRFSTDDTLDPIHNVSEEWVAPRLAKVCSVLDKLPDREADLVRLYFFLDKRQTDIAEIFGITQAAVSYRLKRALDRIRFLVEMPDLNGDEIYLILEDCFHVQTDVDIFSEMFFSTCQSDVAEKLGITQGRVRHRFIKQIRHFGLIYLDKLYAWVSTLNINTLEYEESRAYLEKISLGIDTLTDKELESRLLESVEWLETLGDTPTKYVKTIAYLYRTFVGIRYNFNILREVKLPKWSGRPVFTIT